MGNKIDTAVQVPAAKRDWTRGPVLRNILLLSWPMVVMELLWAGSQIIDMVWVGRLGSHSIAGVGIANIIFMLVMTIDIGIVMGSRAVIARRIGEGDFKGASNAAGQTIFIGAIWGICVTFFGLLLTKPMLGLFGLDAAVAAEATTYMRIMLAGWVTMEVLVMCLYSIQSSGDAVTPLSVEVVIRAIHLTLCPMLVLGLWVFPRLGVGGAALSNVVSQSLGAIILLVILFRGRTRLKLSPRDFFPVPDILRRILKIGIPALMMNLQKSLGDLILMRLIVPFGTIAVAANSLVLRLELLLLAPCLGMGGGTGVLVGQNLGAGQPERAQRSGWISAGVMAGFMFTCALAILIWAEVILSIFTNEGELLQVGGLFLRIAAAGFVLLSILTVLQGAIAGAGDTLPTMIFSIIMIWVVQVPLALTLPHAGGLGVYGIRWAIVIGNLVGATLCVIYFLLGRWKKKRV